MLNIVFPSDSGSDATGATSTWGRTPQIGGSQTPAYGSMTPSYGSMTPLPVGARTPMQGSQTPMQGGES